MKARLHSRKGFTLVETAIAMGMVAIMISAFMVAFGPAVKSIKKSISAKEAGRLADALEHELSILRAGELEPLVGGEREPDDDDDDYVTAFEKAYNWIKQSGTKATAVLIYQYRGNPASVRADGTLAPYTGNGTIPGVDYVIQTAVRRLNNAFVEGDLEPGVLEGKVYYAKMEQLIFNASGVMEVTTWPNEIRDPYDSANGNTTYDTVPNAYPDAVIAYRVRFYIVPNVLYSYIDSASWTVANPGTLVLTKNMAAAR